MVLVVLDKCEVDISSGAAIPSRKEMERMIQPPLVSPLSISQLADVFMYYDLISCGVLRMLICFLKILV